MDIDSMRIEKLIDYINGELNKGRSMKEIENNDFGVNDRVITKRLKRRGYSRKDNEFVMDNTLVHVSSEPILQPKSKPKRPLNDDIDINVLRELIGLIEPIKEVIQEYNKSKTFVEVSINQLNPPPVIEVKQKLFKIDTQVLEKWEKFVQDHKEYKVQSLISLALTEFIDKYK